MRRLDGYLINYTSKSGLDEFHVTRKKRSVPRPCRVRLNIAVKFFPLGILFDRECDTLIRGLGNFILVRDIY